MNLLSVQCITASPLVILPVCLWFRQRLALPLVLCVLCILTLNAHAAERVEDADLDGVPDTVDLDDDNDGLLDISEISADGADLDADRDGQPNRLDLDSDNDGILDLEESGVFLLSGFELVRIVGGRLRAPVGVNGVADFLETAPDSSIARFSPLNSDESQGDLLPDFLDLDSDNDGLLDLIEAGVPASLDQNRDGRIDAPPGSVGADGILDTVQLNNDANCCDYTLNGVEDITPRNTDQMDYPDFQDIDSDNDGVFDLVEAGGTDLDGDGRVDGFIDNPSSPDGIDDALALVPLTPADNNANGVPDFIDAQVQAPISPPEVTPTPDNESTTVDQESSGEESSPAQEVVEITGDGTQGGSTEPESEAANDEPVAAGAVPDIGVTDDAPNLVQTGLSGSGGCTVRRPAQGDKNIDPLLPGMLVFAIFWLMGRRCKVQPE